jgi:3',5'-cyclic-AMP phosphodiesterase
MKAGTIQQGSEMTDIIRENLNPDGIDRRGFLKCMAWAGTGTLCLVQGGVLKSYALGNLHKQSWDSLKADLSFVQISDSHIGFNKAANPDVTATLREAIAKINALPTPPAFVLHTGDLTQLSTPDEFDTLDQELKNVRTDSIFFVPGEHDVLNDNGQQYLARFGKNTKGGGWYSFDHSGAHFIGLINVLNLKAGGLGSLGPDQLEWLEKDVKRLKSSTPIVVFAHIPLWTIYPQWGWGTDDSEQALSYLKRFGSVTVLNGHIHQTMQKVEGNITFHTAMSTAFPQPAPGTAPSPGPMVVPADKLRSVLGVRDVTFNRGTHTLAVVDSTLQG